MAFLAAQGCNDTVLTQKRWLLFGAAASALGGAVLGVVAWL